MVLSIAEEKVRWQARPLDIVFNQRAAGVHIADPTERARFNRPCQSADL
jgi:hypothetical protein